jgi:hypothetical protein
MSCHQTDPQTPHRLRLPILLISRLLGNWASWVSGRCWPIAGRLNSNTDPNDPLHTTCTYRLPEAQENPTSGTKSILMGESVTLSLTGGCRRELRRHIRCRPCGVIRRHENPHLAARAHLFAVILTQFSTQRTSVLHVFAGILAVPMVVYIVESYGYAASVKVAL